MSDSYVVRYQDVVTVQNDYAILRQKIIDSIETSEAAIDAMVSLDTFGGSGAEAIKSYLGEVHLELCGAFLAAVNNLAIKYAKNYCDEFGNSPVQDASFGSSWTYKGMESAENKLKQLVRDDCEDVKGYIKEALLYSSEAGCPIESIDTSLFEQDCSNERRLTKEVRKGVSDIEKGVENAFSSQSDVQALLVGLSGMVGKYACNGASITSYKSGSFSAACKKSGFSSLLKKTRSYNEKNLQGYFDSLEFSSQLELNALTNDIDKKLEQKKYWQWLSFVCTLIEWGGSLTAIFSAGAAIPLIVAILKFGLNSADLLEAGADLSYDGLDKYKLEDFEVVDEGGVKVIKVGEKVLTKLSDYRELESIYINEGDDGVWRYLFNGDGSDAWEEIKKQILSAGGEEFAAEIKALETYCKAGNDLMDFDLEGGVSVGSMTAAVSPIAENRIKSLDSEAQVKAERIDEVAEMREATLGHPAEEVKYSKAQHAKAMEGGNCALLEKSEPYVDYDPVNKVIHEGAGADQSKSDPTTPNWDAGLNNGSDSKPGGYSSKGGGVW